jgi:hypothetical protein
VCIKTRFMLTMLHSVLNPVNILSFHNKGIKGYGSRISCSSVTKLQDKGSTVSLTDRL